jgi:hypothetical protein
MTEETKNDWWLPAAGARALELIDSAATQEAEEKQDLRPAQLAASRDRFASSLGTRQAELTPSQAQFANATANLPLHSEPRRPALFSIPYAHRKPESR